MSHSSLSAQLASLHQKNTTSSRQQSDAVGRGIHHSSQAGHSIFNNSNTKHKPSVIYEDSRAAARADVPFTTLRENAVASLEYLAENCSPLFYLSGDNLPWQTLFGSKSIKYERGLNTPETNEKFDRMIKEALFLLSSAWGDSASTIATSNNTNIQVGTSIPSSVLHAMEYLVQKYYVHVHNAENLLVSYLPHHETFLFDRLLQLIDLAQFPHWAFLRPYSGATGVTGVPRTTIAKWAASTKDNGGGTALLKKVCDIARRGAKIHVLERALLEEGSTHEIRRGNSLFISFTAAIIAESLHIQYSSIGTIDEATLRCLVFYVLAAVEPSNSKKVRWSQGALCPEWRSFGYIVISLLVDKCDVSNELCEAFATGIVKGAVESIRLIQSECSDTYDEDGDKNMNGNFANMQSILDISSDAILALFNLVSNNVAKDQIDDDLDRYLPLINKNSKVGCVLPYSSYKSLTKLPYLYSTFGYLVEEKNIDVKELISSIISIAISAFVNSNGEKKSLKIVMDLINESTLEKYWEGLEDSMTASVAAFIIQKAVSSGDISQIVESLGDLLNKIRERNAIGCDAGVAFAVKHASSVSDEQTKTSNGEVIKDLLTKAGIIDDTIHLQNKKKNKKNKAERLDEDFSSILPPIVAVEHPTESLRLDSVSKLVENPSSHGGAENIASTLLRRYVLDDKISVAEASAEGLIRILSDGNLSENFFLQITVAKDLTVGLSKWTKDIHEGIIVNSLDLCGKAGKIMKENMMLYDSDDQDGEVETFFEEMVSIMITILSDDSYPKACKNAASRAFYSITATGSMPKTDSALRKKIVQSDFFHEIVNSCISKMNSMSNIDLHSEKNILTFFNSEVGNVPQNKCTQEMLHLIVDSSLAIANAFSPNTDPTSEVLTQFEIIHENLKTAVSYLMKKSQLGDVIKVLLDLSNIQCEDAYSNISEEILSSTSNSVLLMELLTCPSIGNQGVERLLAIIPNILPKIDSDMKKSLLVCVLALCCHSSFEVRQLATDFFSGIEENFFNEGDEQFRKALSSLSYWISASEGGMKSQLLMDGSAALPKVLRSAVNDGKGHSLKSILLKGCADLVTNHIIIENGTPIGDGGLCHAFVSIMDVLESCGETLFNLSTRWIEVGCPVLNHYIGKASLKPNASLHSVLDSVIMMLKGVVIRNEDDGVTISTGPAVSGRRKRSYSIGQSSAISHINPYPSDMVDTILALLQKCIDNADNDFLLECAESLNKLVLQRTSWSEGIFPKLKDAMRKELVQKIVLLRSHCGLESAGLVLLGLPLTASQLIDILSDDTLTVGETDGQSLIALTCITDCIRVRSSFFNNVKDALKLSELLYDTLKYLSRLELQEDGSDYARTCVISALLAITSSINTKKIEKKFTKSVSSHSKLLVSLLGDDKSNFKKLISGRSKTLCLQLLTHLCMLSPNTVIESLVPALINSISFSGENGNISKDAMSAILPAYCKYAPLSNLSIYSLLSAFLEKCNEEEEMSWDTQLHLYKHMNKALVASCESKYKGSACAALVTAFVGNEAFERNTSRLRGNEETTNFVNELLLSSDATVRIDSTLKILQYVSNLTKSIQSNDGKKIDEEDTFLALSSSKLCNLIINGPTKKGLDKSMPSTQKDRLSIFWVAKTLLHTVRDTFRTKNVKQLIRHAEDSLASICLKIWQELMLLQSTTTTIRFSELDSSSTHAKLGDNLWTSICDDVNDVLCDLQNLLPVPHFLASVSALVTDNEANVDIQRKAILLLAERSREIDQVSNEAVLFLEMLPELVNIAGAPFQKAEQPRRRNMAILSQASFKAIDQLTKNLVLSLSVDKKQKKRANSFLPSLHAVTSCLKANVAFPSESASEEDISTFNQEIQVVSSAAMCAASLITLLGAKSLPSLPKIVKPLIALLSTANRIDNMADVENDTTQNAVFVLQMSTLRALIAMGEQIPQFFVTYVEGLLDHECLPAPCLRTGNNEDRNAISNLAERLEQALANGSPARHLIPILSKCVSKCLKKEGMWKESLTILRILKNSIEKASRKDIGPLAGKIITALTHTYSFDCDIATRCELVDAGNNTLLAMVMKLSEAQLRPLYGKLREWRGDINEESSSSFLHLRKRNAFWNLSTAMIKELRSIFLPCMSTVVGDIAKELEDAVSILCTVSKSSKGSKRVKIDNVASIDPKTLSPLQPLLHCLESALKADAYDGGNWIRGDDGERYTQILRPLMKLLTAQVPDGCDILPVLQKGKIQYTPYQRLVQGETTDDYGNVVNCITSLAAAAGNEQLWKPLNHSLLEACGNEKRSEVRKSGVKSLLSIIHTLGEEYMVLLPECLPVLSELLEDEDEDIVALAKECVQQGEELLGESLEDSLR